MKKFYVLVQANVFIKNKINKSLNIVICDQINNYSLFKR